MLHLEVCSVAHWIIITIHSVFRSCYSSRWPIDAERTLNPYVSNFFSCCITCRFLFFMCLHCHENKAIASHPLVTIRRALDLSHSIPSISLPLEEHTSRARLHFLVYYPLSFCSSESLDKQHLLLQLLSFPGTHAHIITLKLFEKTTWVDCALSQ